MSMNTNAEELMISITKLTTDLKKATSSMSVDEVRFLVDSYYQMQDNRIRSNNQVRQISDEPHEVLSWLAKQSDMLENQIKGALDKYSMHHDIGKRIRNVHGVGPVIAAGLLSHIDIEKAPTAGAIWRFAGLDPTMEWKKKTKRPFNARLKTLCWKLGESFVKVCNKEDSLYGRLYRERKEYENKKNDNLELRDIAEKKLEKFNIGKDTDAYKAYSQGKLPPAHIHARAKRYAVKLFLSHLHEAWYEHHYNKPVPRPYVMEHKGHTHKIEVPF